MGTRSKRNCWEFKKCGREAGGSKVAELGMCPASSQENCDGVNDGDCGGRACWAIAGTYCGGTVQGSFATKLHRCLECDFYKLVRREQGRDWFPAKAILEIIGNPQAPARRSPNPD